MRTLLAATALLLFATDLIASEIPAAEAKNHIGEQVTIRGTVTEVKVVTKAIFLDIDGKYPNQAFSVVSFTMTDAAALKAFRGQTIAVTGIVVLYKGRPEILLHSIDQIAIAK